MPLLSATNQKLEDRLQRLIREFGTDIIPRATRPAAEMLHQRVARRAPKRTGRYRRSVIVVSTERGSSVIIPRAVFGGSYYPLFLEYSQRINKKIRGRIRRLAKRNRRAVFKIVEERVREEMRNRGNR